MQVRGIHSKAPVAQSLGQNTKKMKKQLSEKQELIKTLFRQTLLDSDVRMIAKGPADLPAMTAQAEPTPDDQLATLIEKTSEWASSHFIMSTYKKHGTVPIERALKSSIKMWQLEDDLGMTKEELFKTAIYIETKLPEKIEQQHYYIKKDTGENSRLPRTIEYDPESNEVFIHLKTHGVRPIGSGWHKKCTRSIVYHTKHPEMAANCVCLDDASKEIDLHKLFKGKEGLIHTFAVTEHVKAKTHKKVTSIILKFYNAGSLRHHQYSKHDLTQKEQVVVARDLLYGLENIHKNNMVHRDLHGNNILVDRRHDSETGKEVVSGVIIDFGQTTKAPDTKKFAPEIQIPRRFNPPEAFDKHKGHVRPKAADIYAIGCNLYHLYYHIQPQWSTSKDFERIGEMSSHEKEKFQKELKNHITQSLNRRKERLEEKKRLGIDTPYDLFAAVILKMCDPDPKKRGSAHKLRVELDNILQKIENREKQQP